MEGAVVHTESAVKEVARTYNTRRGWLRTIKTMKAWWKGSKMMRKGTHPHLQLLCATLACGELNSLLRELVLYT